MFIIYTVILSPPKAGYKSKHKENHACGAPCLPVLGRSGYVCRFKRSGCIGILPSMIYKFLTGMFVNSGRGQKLTNILL